MIYTTMTRGKVLRLIARGWEPSEFLLVALKIDYDYFEITFRRFRNHWVISGFGYIPLDDIKNVLSDLNKEHREKK